MSSALDKVLEKSGGNLTFDTSQVKSNAAGSNASKIMAHQHAMLEHCFKVMGSGDPKRIGSMIAYWEECTNLVVEKIQEWYPNRRGEISPREIGMIETSLKTIVGDGVRSGKAPREFLEPYFEQRILTPNKESYVEKAQPSETVQIYFSTKRGVDRIASAIDRLIERLNSTSRKALANAEIDPDTLRSLIDGGNSSMELATHVYQYARKKSTVVTQHMAGISADQTIANNATVSRTSTYAVDRLVSRMDHASNDFFNHIVKVWSEPLERSDIVDQGALIGWLKNEVDHYSRISMTLLDTHTDFVLKGTGIVDARLAEKEEKISHALSNGALEKILNPDGDEVEPTSAPSPRPNSFGALLKKSGFNVENQIAEKEPESKDLGTVPTND